MDEQEKTELFKQAREQALEMGPAAKPEPEGEQRDKIELRVDLDALSIGDLETLETSKSIGVQIQILQRAINNVDLRKLPLRRLPEIVARVRDSIQRTIAQKN